MLFLFFSYYENIYFILFASQISLVLHLFNKPKIMFLNLVNVCFFFTNLKWSITCYFFNFIIDRIYFISGKYYTLNRKICWGWNILFFKGNSVKRTCPNCEAKLGFRKNANFIHWIRFFTKKYSKFFLILKNSIMFKKFV